MLAEHAGATIAAGGKRLRPLLVFVAAGPPADGDGAGVLRAAVAVELIHSATLVHDDVLDGAALRRGRPTVVATAGRELATATGDLLFSRAFAELAANGRADEIRVLSAASSALAEGELMQRADAWNVGDVARALPRPLRPQDRAAVRGGVRARARSRAAGRPSCWGASGAASASPSSCSTTCSTSQGPAERTGKHRGTDLLDGTVTLPLILARERDPELAALDLRSVRTPEQAEAVCDAIARHGRARGGAGRRARDGRRGEGGPAGAARRAAGRARAGGRRGRRPLQLEVHGPDGVRGERGGEALDLVFHVGLR